MKYLFTLGLCLAAIAGRAEVVDLADGPGFDKIVLEYEKQVAWPNLPPNPERPAVADAWFISFPRMFRQHVPSSRKATLYGMGRLTALAMKHGLNLPGHAATRVDLNNAYVRDLTRLAHPTSERLPVSVMNLKIYAEAPDHYDFKELREFARGAINELVETVIQLFESKGRDLELLKLDLRVLAYLATPRATDYVQKARGDHRPGVGATARILRKRPPCAPFFQ